MKIQDPVSYTVHVHGREYPTRLWDLLKQELNVAERPERIYFWQSDSTLDHPAVKSGNAVTVVCAGDLGTPYIEYLLDIGQNRLPSAEPFIPVVLDRRPINYVRALGPLYEFRTGELFKWRQTAGDLISPCIDDKWIVLQVVGTGPDGALRVKLPHRPQEWIMRDHTMWMERRPTPLELRVQELELDNPFKDDSDHPLHSIRYLWKLGRRERYFYRGEDRLRPVVFFEWWEEVRQAYDLTIDDAIIALKSSVLDEDRYGERWPFEYEAVRKYTEDFWGPRDPEDVLRRMSEIFTLEHWLIGSAMKAVEESRRLYARETFRRLMGEGDGHGAA